MVNAENLFWLDLEMSGLNPLEHHILEIACVVTDKDLNILAEGPSFAIQQSSEHLNTMPIEVRNMHTTSGLLNRVDQSTITLGFAEREVISFFMHYCLSGITVLCGNSIWVDRTFLKQHMPHLDACFNYRMIDVSTIKELVARWYPDIAPFKKNKNHIALEDVYESIAELRYHRDVYFK